MEKKREGGNKNLKISLFHWAVKDGRELVRHPDLPCFILYDNKEWERQIKFKTDDLKQLRRPPTMYHAINLFSRILKIAAEQWFTVLIKRCQSDQWFFWCLLKWPTWIDAKSHWLHLYGFSPQWVLTCFLKLSARADTKSHWLHLWYFSLEWVFKCLLK